MIILTLVGLSGLLAAWSGAWELGDGETGSLSLFLLLSQLPAWVVGVVLIMTVSLSTAAFDSFQSAMISTGSNDFFRNKLNIWFIRACVVLIIIPVVIVALRSPDILQIFLISDLVSAAVVPCLVIGLSDRCYWYRGFDFVVGGLGGIFTIFLFGLVYYDGDVTLAGRLLLLEGGLYANDWSAFGKTWSIREIATRANTCQVPSSQHHSEAFSGPLVLAASASASSISCPRSKDTILMLWTALFPAVRPSPAISRRRSKMLFWNRPSRLTRAESFSRVENTATEWVYLNDVRLALLSLQVSGAVGGYTDRYGRSNTEDVHRLLDIAGTWVCHSTL